MNVKKENAMQLENGYDWTFIIIRMQYVIDLNLYRYIKKNWNFFFNGCSWNKLCAGISVHKYL